MIRQTVQKLQKTSTKTPWFTKNMGFMGQFTKIWDIMGHFSEIWDLWDEWEDCRSTYTLVLRQCGFDAVGCAAGRASGL